MFYKLLGYVVWNGGKVFLRKRYGSSYVPKGVLIGGAVAAVGGAALVAAASRRNGSS
jgi:hypothetical protein